MIHITRLAPICLIGVLAQFVRADISAELTQASAPLSEGVPEVAVVRLQELLNKSSSESDRQAVTEKLAEAQIAANEPEDTLVLLADPRLRDLPWAKFWRAQALATLHRWADALPLYQELTKETSSSHKAAVFGAGETLRALGKRQQALTEFNVLIHDKEWGARAQLRAAELFIELGNAADAARLLEKMEPASVAERRERRLLRGRLELILHRPERAIGMFQAILKRPEGMAHSILIAALFGIAEAHLQLNTPETGDDILERFIDQHPADPDLPSIFAKLDELYRAEHKPSRNELEKWVRRPEQPRRTFARWYLARLEIRAGRRERARQLFADVRRTGIKSSAIVPALFEFAQFEIDDGHFDEALAILDDARLLHPDQPLLTRIDFLSAQTQYFAGRFDTATAGFEQIARAESPWAKVALFNASSGWLELGNHARFLADYSQFQQEGGNEQSRADLRLEEGLMAAAKNGKKAGALLQQFIHDFPNNPRVSEAWVSLAELAFHSSPPRLDEARKDLNRAAASTPTAAAAERADYLRIWVEEAAGGDDSKVIELAKRFLEQHGQSPFASEVRMKLAELYYRRQDFANAQTQFETIAQQNPNDSLSEKALFFAAESAMLSMSEHTLDRALVLFDQVVQKNGAMRWTARNEEAVIERKLGKPKEALTLYDEVLKSDAGASEKREALCGKGDIFFESGASDPSNYQRAIEAYEELAADKDASIHWRNQALFKKGLCLEKKGDRAGALATFYRILEDESRPGERRELFWYYKAGFNAARLLEEDSKWESAVAIYDKLVATGGNRSEEAKARLNNIRLEHFLWTD
ncbi:MAG TPA: tetratricopeptide repeat protein [Candidatus Udaeobacter sp.]|jgi:TolA-binding protein|nr:tetratricopeptide repeat protein [Candidatus Udaeobacter sp.]